MSGTIKPSTIIILLYLISGRVGAGAYEECVLDKMKGQDIKMQSIVEQLCADKTEPKKCRGLKQLIKNKMRLEYSAKYGVACNSTNIDNLDNLRIKMHPKGGNRYTFSIVEPYETQYHEYYRLCFDAWRSRGEYLECLETCQNDSWWSRKAGECSP